MKLGLQRGDRGRAPRPRPSRRARSSARPGSAARDPWRAPSRSRRAAACRRRAGAGSAACTDAGIGDLDAAERIASARSCASPRPTPRDGEDLGHLLADSGSTGSAPRRGSGRPSRRRRRAAPQLAARAAPSTSRPATRIAPARDPAVARQIAHDGERRGRLAAARLADEPVRLAALDRERDAAQHLALDAAHAVDDVEVAHLERGRGGGALEPRSSLEHLRGAVGDEVDRDDERARSRAPGNSTVHQ